MWSWLASREKFVEDWEGRHHHVDVHMQALSIFSAVES